MSVAKNEFIFHSYEKKMVPRIRRNSVTALLGTLQQTLERMNPLLEE